MNRTLRIIGSRLLLLCLALCLLFSGCSKTDTPAQSSGKTTINVYNWGQYISDGTDGYLDVNKAFTEETGIEVNYITYDSNETMYTKLKTGGSSYDVIVPSDYMYSYRLRFTLPTDAGCLNYLRGREFAVEQVEFAEKYFPGIDISQNYDKMQNTVI